MADLRAYELTTFLGPNADNTLRTDTSLALKLWPIDPGSNAFEGDKDVQDIPTEDGDRGISYDILNAKNVEEKSISGPYFPELGSYINHCGTSSDYRTAAGLPFYLHMQRQLGSGNLGVTVSGNANADIGEDLRGLIMKTMSMTFDRNGGGVISLSLGGFMNADRAMAYFATTSTDNETAGSDVVFTCADGSGFTKGDYVTIVDTDNSVTVTGAQVKSVSGNDITITTLTANVDGSGATALTITRTLPPHTKPTLNPYPQTNTFFDLEVAADGGSFAAEWTGNNSDVQSASIEYDNDLAVEDPTASSDAALAQAWTSAIDGTPSLSGTLTLRLAEDAYLDYKRGANVRICRLRIMGYSAEGDSTTTTGTANAGTNVNVAVADESDFAVDEYVLLTDGTNQAVAKITATAANQITVDTLDADIASGASVFNTAFELKVPKARISATPKSADDRRYLITLNFDGRIEPTNTELLITKGYDHAA